MRYEEYVVHGRKGDPGPCNIVDVWNGEFKYDMVVDLPCGCQIHVGDLAIAQKNNWPSEISRYNDFAFSLFCVCGEKIFSAPSAARHQDESGWPYIF